MKGLIFLRGNNSLPLFSAWKTRRSPGLTLGAGIALALLSGCGTHLAPGTETGRHLPAPPDASAASGIPQVVTPLPLIEPPQPEDEPELYTAVVQDVPVRELLFTIARDANINVDVHPDVAGYISLNAVDQTLPQILERISRQIDMRWYTDEFGNLVVQADNPVWRNYKIDYVNVTRTSTSETLVATSIANSAGSTTTMTQTTGNDFWTALPANIIALLSTGDAESTTEDLERWVVTNPGSGMVSVRGTARQHDAVAAFLDQVQTRSLYQVLIEVTVVEVNLSDDYQAGVDWETLNRNGGEINFFQTLTDTPLQNSGSPATNVLTIDRRASPDAISATVAMLSQFGELRVLSSPKIMALNNQSAMLRVVNNSVFFTIDVQPPVLSDNGNILSPAIYTTNVNTIPVGFVMTIVPQIGEDDQVTLNVRPTISRVVRDVPDPNPALAQYDIVNTVPEVQMSEMESVLKIYSGQVAILGGLMQDSISTAQDGLPVLSRLPGVRNLFSYRDERATKTELIIFIRPVIVREPSLQGDLADYRDYLPSNGLEPTGPLLPEGTLSLPGGE
jgi:general secretion pathway protein D